MKKIWDCKIGEVDAAKLPDGADMPMRRAVQAAYRELVEAEPAFCFSGWGGELTEGERACVEDRLPDPAKALDCKGAMDTLSQAMSLDQGYAWAWHCNVAMAAVDAGASHQEANERAADFMKNAFGVDTRAYEHFPKAAPSPPPSPQPQPAQTPQVPAEPEPVAWRGRIGGARIPWVYYTGTPNPHPMAEATIELLYLHPPTPPADANARREDGWLFVASRSLYEVMDGVRRHGRTMTNEELLHYLDFKRDAALAQQSTAKGKEES